MLCSSLHAGFPLVSSHLKRQLHSIFINPSTINMQHAYLCKLLQNTIKMQITSIAVQPRNWFQKRQQKETEVKSALEYVYLHACTCSGSDSSYGVLKVDSFRIYCCSNMFWQIPFEAPVICLQHQQLSLCSAISSWL